MDEKWIAIVGGSTVVVFILYRRLMRLFSRQRYSTLRVLLPVGLFGLLALFLFPMLSLTAGLAPTAGVVAGIALGLYGFRLTRFEIGDNEIYFTPDPYIGSIVLAMFVGRMVYRVLVLGSLGDVATAGTTGMSVPAGLGRSPLSAALLFVLFGYYLSYYVSIWIRGRALRESMGRT